MTFGQIVIVQRDGTDSHALDLDRLEANALTFGRDPCRDIRINKPEVSRLHCQLAIDDSGSVFLHNLSQVNPVLVCGKPVTHPIQLRDNDLIDICGSLFRYESQTDPTVEISARYLEAHTCALTYLSTGIENAHPSASKDDKAATPHGLRRSSRLRANSSDVLCPLVDNHQTCTLPSSATGRVLRSRANSSAARKSLGNPADATSASAASADRENKTEVIPKSIHFVMAASTGRGRRASTSLSTYSLRGRNESLTGVSADADTHHTSAHADAANASEHEPAMSTLSLDTARLEGDLPRMASLSAIPVEQDQWVPPAQSGPQHPLTSSLRVEAPSLSLAETEANANARVSSTCAPVEGDGGVVADSSKVITVEAGEEEGEENLSSPRAATPLRSCLRLLPADVRHTISSHARALMGEPLVADKTPTALLPSSNDVGMAEAPASDARDAAGPAGDRASAATPSQAPASDEHQVQVVATRIPAAPRAPPPPPPARSLAAPAKQRAPPPAVHHGDIAEQVRAAAERRLMRARAGGQEHGLSESSPNPSASTEAAPKSSRSFSRVAGSPAQKNSAGAGAAVAQAPHGAAQPHTNTQKRSAPPGDAGFMSELKERLRARKEAPKQEPAGARTPSRVTPRKSATPSKQLCAGSVAGHGVAPAKGAGRPLFPPLNSHNSSNNGDKNSQGCFKPASSSKSKASSSSLSRNDAAAALRSSLVSAIARRRMSLLGQDGDCEDDPTRDHAREARDREQCEPVAFATESPAVTLPAEVKMTKELKAKEAAEVGLVSGTLASDVEMPQAEEPDAALPMPVPRAELAEKAVSKEAVLAGEEEAAQGCEDTVLSQAQLAVDSITGELSALGQFREAGIAMIDHYQGVDGAPGEKCSGSVDPTVTAPEAVEKADEAGGLVVHEHDEANGAVAVRDHEGSKDKNVTDKGNNEAAAVLDLSCYSPMLSVSSSDALSPGRAEAVGAPVCLFLSPVSLRAAPLPAIAEEGTPANSGAQVSTPPLTRVQVSTLPMSGARACTPLPPVTCDVVGEVAAASTPAEAATNDDLAILHVPMGAGAHGGEDACQVTTPKSSGKMAWAEVATMGAFSIGGAAMDAPITAGKGCGRTPRQESSSKKSRVRKERAALAQAYLAAVNDGGEGGDEAEAKAVVQEVAAPEEATAPLKLDFSDVALAATSAVPQEPATKMEVPLEAGPVVERPRGPEAQETPAVVVAPGLLLQASVPPCLFTDAGVALFAEASHGHDGEGRRASLSLSQVSLSQLSFSCGTTPRRLSMSKKSRLRTERTQQAAAHRRAVMDRAAASAAVTQGDPAVVVVASGVNSVGVAATVVTSVNAGAALDGSHTAGCAARGDPEVAAPDGPATALDGGRGQVGEEDAMRPPPVAPALPERDLHEGKADGGQVPMDSTTAQTGTAITQALAPRSGDNDRVRELEARLVALQAEHERACARADEEARRADEQCTRATKEAAFCKKLKVRLGKAQAGAADAEGQLARARAALQEREVQLGAMGDRVGALQGEVASLEGAREAAVAAEAEARARVKSLKRKLRQQQRAAAVAAVADNMAVIAATATATKADEAADAVEVEEEGRCRSKKPRVCVQDAECQVVAAVATTSVGVMAELRPADKDEQVQAGAACHEGSCQTEAEPVLMVPTSACEAQTDEVAEVTPVRLQVVVQVVVAANASTAQQEASFPSIYDAVEAGRPQEEAEDDEMVPQGDVAGAEDRGLEAHEMPAGYRAEANGMDIEQAENPGEGGSLAACGSSSSGFGVFCEGLSQLPGCTQGSACCVGPDDEARTVPHVAGAHGLAAAEDNEILGAPTDVAAAVGQLEEVGHLEEVVLEDGNHEMSRVVASFAASPTGAKNAAAQEAEAEDDCFVCRGVRGDEAGVLLICDGCERYYHLVCCEPPLEHVPAEDKWLCHLCDGARVAKVKVSEGEDKAALVASNSDSSGDGGQHDLVATAEQGAGRRSSLRGRSNKAPLAVTGDDASSEPARPLRKSSRRKSVDAAVVLAGAAPAKAAAAPRAKKAKKDEVKNSARESRPFMLSPIAECVETEAIEDKVVEEAAPPVVPTKTRSRRASSVMAASSLLNASKSPVEEKGRSRKRAAPHHADEDEPHHETEGSNIGRRSLRSRK